MNKRELSEIRRRINIDKNCIDCIRGCYVNSKKEIVSVFNRSLLSMPQEEAEKYLQIFRRTLTGMPGKNLLDIGFSADKVMDGDEHALLSALRNTALKVDQAVEKFFDRVIGSLEIEDHYLILLMHDTYDIPFRAKYENRAESVSEESFHYILCAICPVKLTRPALAYCAEDNIFHDRDLDWVVSMPEVGFLFPSYEDGGSNIYGCVYYTKDAADSHGEFVDGIFGTRAPMPAKEQKETFEALLSDTLQEDCNLEVVQTVHEQLRERVEAMKADKSPEIPMITKNEVSNMLERCGVPEERVAAFQEKYDEEFGPAVDLSMENIVNIKKFELKTPDVVVNVNPERSDLVQTRMIDGSRYILIRADEGVEVNGVNIAIGDADDSPF